MILANADLNNYRTPGNYYCNTNANAQTMSNCPEQVAFTLKVIYAAGTSYVAQIFQSYQDGKAYFRRAQTTNPGDDSWTEWMPYATGDIDQYSFSNDTYLATNVYVKKSGRTVTMSYWGNLNTMPVANGDQIILGTLPEEYRPFGVSVCVVISAAAGKMFYQLTVQPDGQVRINNYSTETYETTHFCRFHAAWIAEK